MAKKKKLTESAVNTISRVYKKKGGSGSAGAYHEVVEQYAGIYGADEVRKVLDLLAKHEKEEKAFDEFMDGQAIEEFFQNNDTEKFIGKKIQDIESGKLLPIIDIIAQPDFVELETGVSLIGIAISDLDKFIKSKPFKDKNTGKSFKFIKKSSKKEDKVEDAFSSPSLFIKEFGGYVEKKFVSFNDGKLILEVEGVALAGDGDGVYFDLEKAEYNFVLKPKDFKRFIDGEDISITVQLQKHGTVKLIIQEEKPEPVIEEVVFKSGAKTPEVNDLVLFTDNTESLVNEASRIYKDYSEEPESDYHLKGAFRILSKKASLKYKKEVGEELKLTQDQEENFADIYASRYDKWKKENSEIKKESEEKKMDISKFKHRPDNLNPILLLQTWDTMLLREILNGEICISELAKMELASRGLNKEGIWVGFEEAKKIHGLK